MSTQTFLHYILSSDRGILEKNQSLFQAWETSMHNLLRCKVRSKFKTYSNTYHIPIGYNAKVRDEILTRAGIRQQKEEESMQYITNLIIISSLYVLFSLIMEIIFFLLYNGSLHPFSKILDISTGIFPIN